MSLSYEQTLSKLIQCPTVSSPTGEICGVFSDFQALLAELFPSVFSVCETEHFSRSLLLRWKGKDSSHAVMFMNHSDVVPAEENNSGWSYPPFSGTVADGKLWGRGSLDTKGGLWAMLQAAEELISGGFVPSCDIYFESSTDEETTSCGAPEVASALKERGIIFDFILDEGGMIKYEPISGVKANVAMVGVGEKCTTDICFHAVSEGGHASTPSKNSPLVRLGKFMAKADKRRIFKAWLSPAIKEMFRRFSPAMSGPLKFVFAHPSFFAPVLKLVMPAVSPTANALVRTTAAFTLAQGSSAHNVIPQDAWVTCNMRSSHHEGKENSIKTLEKVAKKFGLKAEITDDGYESPLADFNNSAFKLIENAVLDVFPSTITAPYIQTGASDSRYMSILTPNCYRFVPFIIDEQQMESIHASNENVNVSSLAPAVKFYKYLMEHTK